MPAGKTTQQTDAGFVMQKAKRSAEGGARAVLPSVPVEEGSAAGKAAAVDQAVEERMDAIAAVAEA
jgi:hypothetical protein